MSIYRRFKNDPNGLRALVQLLETTPEARRLKMIEAGMQEDPFYTEKALAYMYSFEDMIALTDAEMAELVGAVPPPTLGHAISELPRELQEKFLKSAGVQLTPQIRTNIQADLDVNKVRAAQLKVIGVARQLEKKGFIQRKKIPTH